MAEHQTAGRNLVFCSDGTGNAGGKRNGTNVWRIYRAVDRDAHERPGGPRQLVFYEDGVGSEDSQLLAAIGGAFGFGITRDLVNLYRRLITHFEPGDRMYFFGFSRGAFTIRTLTNILNHSGIASVIHLEGKQAGQRMNPAEIDRVAADAIAAYKERHNNPQKTRDFRLKFSRRDAPAIEDVPEEETRGRFPLHFVGVWDTVDAVGLPFDELTQVMLPLLRLNLRRGSDDWDPLTDEDDLHDYIVNAYHGISTDDERLTFHPVLWYENSAVLKDGKIQRQANGRIESTPKNGTPFATAANGQTRKVEQVWFPGVHANVGGGYPKDQLSLVALDWMMQHAHREGLVFDGEVWKELRKEADQNAKLYDSRAGGGAYYRYMPRVLGTICRESGIEKPVIHESVFNRIQQNVQSYAPNGIPHADGFQVVGDPEVSESSDEDGSAAGDIRTIDDFSPTVDLRKKEDLKEQNLAERMTCHEHASALILLRRILYFVFVFWTLSLLPTAWVASQDWSPFQPATTGAAAQQLDSRLAMIGAVLRWEPYLDVTSVFWWVVGTVAVIGGIGTRVSARPLGAEHPSARHPYFKLLRNVAVLAGILAFWKPTVVFFVESLTPKAVEAAAAAVAGSTVLLLTHGVLLYLIVQGSAAVKRGIRNADVHAWAAAFGTDMEPLKVTIWHRLGHRLMKSGSFMSFSLWFRRRFTPFLAVSLLLIGVSMGFLLIQFPFAIACRMTGGIYVLFLVLFLYGRVREARMRRARMEA